jgi:hypothetical protein
LHRHTNRHGDEPHHRCNHQPPPDAAHMKLLSCTAT